MPEHQKMQQSGKPDSTSQKQAILTSQTQVSHPASIIQRARINPKSLTSADVLQLQRTIGNRAVGRLLSEIRNPSKVQQVPIQRQEIPEEEEPLQGKFETIQRLEPEEEEKLQMKSVAQRQEIPEEEEPLQGKMTDPVQHQEMPEEEEPLQGKMIGTVQRQEIPEEEEPLQKKSENNTGMPDNLKAGVESLSGIDMSDVRVHYNSDKPSQVGALAYTQGTNIHVAPGQKKHLPHEAWHVVQQKQGRVQPTTQINNLSINDDTGFEREADLMGSKILGEKKHQRTDISYNIVKTGNQVVQRFIQIRYLPYTADEAWTILTRELPFLFNENTEHKDIMLEILKKLDSLNKSFLGIRELGGYLLAEEKQRSILKPIAKAPSIKPWYDILTSGVIGGTKEEEVAAEQQTSQKSVPESTGETKEREEEPRVAAATTSKIQSPEQSPSPSPPLLEPVPTSVAKTKLEEFLDRFNSLNPDEQRKILTLFNGKDKDKEKASKQLGQKFQISPKLAKEVLNTKIGVQKVPEQKGERSEIKQQYSVKKACVLQALISMRINPFDCKSAKELHDYIMEKKPEFTEYDLDTIYPKLYKNLGLQYRKCDNIKYKELTSKLPNGIYIMIMAGATATSESHMFAVEIKEGEGIPIEDPQNSIKIKPKDSIKGYWTSSKS